MCPRLQNLIESFNELPVTACACGKGVRLAAGVGTVRRVVANERHNLLGLTGAQQRGVNRESGRQKEGEGQVVRLAAVLVTVRSVVANGRHDLLSRTAAVERQ